MEENKQQELFSGDLTDEELKHFLNGKYTDEVQQARENLIELCKRDPNFIKENREDLIKWGIIKEVQHRGMVFNLPEPTEFTLEGTAEDMNRFRNHRIDANRDDTIELPEDFVAFSQVGIQRKDGSASRISTELLENVSLNGINISPEELIKMLYAQPLQYYPLPKEKAILGIDPGSNGALAILKPTGEVSTYKIPETPKDLFDLLKSLANEYTIECMLEKVGGMPKMGGSSMFNFGKGYGYLEMALIALEIKTTLTSPQAWQKTFMIGTKSKLSTTEWKNKLKALAQQLFPHLKVTLGNADALLILEYARKLNLK